MLTLLCSGPIGYGPRSKCWATLALESSVNPQVWYFAFQEPQGVAWMWFRYGVVRKRWGEALLLNFVYMGEVERIHPPPDADSIFVQTYLPPRKTTYRIVSLHPFEASVCEAPAAEALALRFRRAGP